VLGVFTRTAIGAARGGGRRPDTTLGSHPRRPPKPNV